MEYWKIDIGKVNEFEFSNEEVEVNGRSSSYLKQKTLEYCL